MKRAYYITPVAPIHRLVQYNYNNNQRQQDRDEHRNQTNDNDKAFEVILQNKIEENEKREPY